MLKNKPTSLVTGGAGFIGSHVANELIKAGHTVVVLDDLSGGFKENVPKKAVFVKGSINDYKLLQKLFKKYKFDYVYHLAAYAAEGLSHFIKRFNYDNNLIGSVNLVNLAVNHNVKCFVFTSSIAVYGHNQVPMHEDMTPIPEDSYGVAKYAVELELAATKKMFGLDYVIFRPHNVYGERQNIGDKYRNVIGIFLNKAMKGEPLPVFGDGTQQRAFSHISDVAPVIALSVHNPDFYNEVFNIGADHPYTINELIDVVRAAHGEPLEVVYHPERNEVKIAYSNHDKIKSVHKTQKYVDLNEGVRKMYAWAKKHGAKKSKDFDNIEINKNLPPSWSPKR